MLAHFISLLFAPLLDAWRQGRQTDWLDELGQLVDPSRKGKKGEDAKSVCPSAQTGHCMSLRRESETNIDLSRFPACCLFLLRIIPAHL